VFPSFFPCICILSAVLRIKLIYYEVTDCAYWGVCVCVCVRTCVFRIAQELLKQKLPRVARLGMTYHVHDVIGADLVVW